MLNERDLRNLEAFVALRAIHRNAGKKKAAEEQGISVDTLTKYVETAENSFGVKLVNEKGRICTLTPAGMKFIEALEPVAEIWDRFNQEKDNRKHVARSVRIGIDIGASSSVLFERFMAFGDKYPALGMEIVPLTDVEKEYKDCDICISRVLVPKATDLALIHKRELACGFFASSKYLSKHGYPANLDDLALKHRLICRDNLKIYDEQYQSILKKTIKNNFVSSCASTVVRLIRYGAGIGVLPLYFKDEGLVCLDNIPSETKMEIYLFAKNKLKDVPRVRTVIDFYKEIFSASAVE